MSENQTSSSKKFVSAAVIASLLVMILLTAGIYLYVQNRPLMTADAAVDAAFDEAYDRMHVRLEELAGLNSPELYYETVLTCAKLADYNGKPELALELLEHPDPSDSAAYAAFAQAAEEQTEVYIYRQAMKLYETGEYARAARLAAQIRSYEPALNLYHMAQTAYQATLPTPTPTQSPTPTPSPTPSPSPTPVPVQLPAEAPSAAPSPIPISTSTPAPTPEPIRLLPEGRLAAGFAHTAVLLEDGTVRAFGDNSHGQLETGEWQNVVYVAAGAYHTLGLTADGRVLACGDNTHLQTETSFYSGVKAIAAGDYASFLLLDNGQVMSTGYLAYDFLNEVTGAQAIWAGSYGLLVQTAEGLYASHPGLLLKEKCVSYVVSRGYTVGRDERGTTYSTTDLVPQWSGAQRLTAGENALIGLTEDGQVLYHTFGRHHQVSFAFGQPVLAAAAGPNHYAFVLADGALEIRYSDGRIRRHSLE